MFFSPFAKQNRGFYQYSFKQLHLFINSQKRSLFFFIWWLPSTYLPHFLDCAGQTTGIGSQHCATNVLQRILCNTELLYIGLRHSATKKQRLFVLFLKYSASLRSSFWGRVIFPRWLHLKHVCCEYRFQDPDDRQQQFGAEGHQHDGGDGDGDGEDGGAEGYQHGGEDDDCAVES